MIQLNNTPQVLISLVKVHSVSGTVIDVSAMEGSGGGLYPSYQADMGTISQILSDDIGEEAYDLTDLSLEDPSQVPPNTWAFYFSDEGPTLRNLNTGDECTLKM